MIKIDKNTHVFSMSPHPVNYTMSQSGDTVIFETKDCFCNNFIPENTKMGVHNPENSNPATGPLYIAGAKKGDVLKIDIIDIELGDVGIFISGPVNKIFERHVKGYHINRIRVKNGVVSVSETLKVQSKPMIGVIGVATEDALSTVLPGAHGGNLDCNDITIGSTVYLPVFVDGGLLCIGDLHALMGDGEIGECGLEIEGKVTVRVSVVKKMKMSTPRVETNDFIEIIGLGKTLEKASEQASGEMLKYMIHELKIEAHEASKRLCLCGNIKICQQVNQIKTVAMKVPKWALE